LKKILGGNEAKIAGAAKDCPIVKGEKQRNEEKGA
jgi:hypothetical protein